MSFTDSDVDLLNGAVQKAKDTSEFVAFLREEMEEYEKAGLDGEAYVQIEAPLTDVQNLIAMLDGHSVILCKMIEYTLGMMKEARKRGWEEDQDPFKFLLEHSYKTGWSDCMSNRAKH